MEVEMDQSMNNNTVATQENGNCEVNANDADAEAEAATGEDSPEAIPVRNIRNFDLNIPLPGSDQVAVVTKPEPEIIDLSSESSETIEPPTSKALVSDEESGTSSNGAVIIMQTQALYNVVFIDLAGSMCMSDEADECDKEFSPRSKKLKITDESKEEDKNGST